MAEPADHQQNPPPRLAWGIAAVVGGTLLYVSGLQMMLEDQSLTSTMMSSGLWRKVVAFFGGEIKLNPADGSLSTLLPFFPLLLVCAACSLTGWFAGAAWLSRRRKWPYAEALAAWGVRGWGWLLLPFVWQILWLLPFGNSWQQFLAFTTPYWWGLGCAGWCATFLALSATADEVDAPSPNRVPIAVWLAIALFVGCYFTLNRQLYAGLQTPHGDSAMYEEHLWNLTHGKGFRSYLDYNTEQNPPRFRLFLGEHIQVVHVLLLPLYWIWPSHVTLEFCESLALAVGAIPVFWMTQRHTQSRRAGIWLACAYLLYFPLHFLDIEVDFKTFRPICFGVPAVLFALDQCERGRFKSMLLLLAVALSAKEDYAIIIAPFGVWIALTKPGDNSPALNTRRWLGAGLAVFGVLYLLCVIKFTIPYFRGGDVHYVRYFPPELGDSPGAMVRSVLTQPFTVAGYVFTLRNVLFALSLLIPVGGLPLLSPSRLAVAAPLFGVLCLNQIAGDTQHHFHAPLLPILFWAAAAGAGRFKAPFPVRWAFTCALVTGVLFSIGPTGLSFWDPDSAFYWRRWYVPGERAEKFAAVIEQIPPDARVASTDFVHPRFTHYERSYDYSDYRPVVPDDTQYIVIDTQHRYSQIKQPSDVKEYRDAPQTWELLPDRTDGYFIILKRRQ